MELPKGRKDPKVRYSDILLCVSMSRSRFRRHEAAWAAGIRRHGLRSALAKRLGATPPKTPLCSDAAAGCTMCVCACVYK